MRNKVRKDVVEVVALARELREEEPSQVSDAVVFALHADRHLVDLTLDLDHVVEDEMHEHHQSVLLYALVLIAQTVDVQSVGVHSK